MKQVYSHPDTQFDFFPFDGKPGRIVAAFMAFYNRRLATLARQRMAAGVLGESNAGWRLLVGGFLPDNTSGKLLFQGLRRWVRAEWRNLFLPPAQSRERAAVATVAQES